MSSMSALQMSMQLCERGQASTQGLNGSMSESFKRLSLLTGAKMTASSAGKLTQPRHELAPQLHGSCSLLLNLQRHWSSVRPPLLWYKVSYRESRQVSVLPAELLWHRAQTSQQDLQRFAVSLHYFRVTCSHTSAPQQGRYLAEHR